MTKQFLLISFLFLLHHPLLADERKEIFDKRSFHDVKTVKDAKAIKQGFKDNTAKIDTFIKDSNLSSFNLSSDTFTHTDEKERTDGKAIGTHAKSKEFTKKIKNMENNVLYDKRLDWTKALDIQKAQGVGGDEFRSKGLLDSDEKLFVIISSSMPEPLVKSYLQRLEPIAQDTVFIMRGAIGGAKKILPTLKWVQQIKKYGEEKYYKCQIDINPNITRRYGIERVPAVVFVTGFNESAMQNNGTEAITPVTESVNIVYGGIDPAAALREIQKRARNKNLESLINTIEGIQ